MRSTAALAVLATLALLATSEVASRQLLELPWVRNYHIFQPFSVVVITLGPSLGALFISYVVSYAARDQLNRAKMEVQYLHIH
jgi:hypothetical protein